VTGSGGLCGKRGKQQDEKCSQPRITGITERTWLSGGAAIKKRGEKGLPTTYRGVEIKDGFLMSSDREE